MDKTKTMMMVRSGNTQEPGRRKVGIHCGQQRGAGKKAGGQQTEKQNEQRDK